MSFNSVRPDNQLLTWQSINSYTERTLKTFIDQLPSAHLHIHINNLRHELLYSPHMVATPAIATKFLSALNTVKVPNIPYQKLTQAIVDRGIFPANEAARFILQQPSKLEELSAALEQFMLEDLREKEINDTINHIVGLVNEGQSLPPNSDLKQNLLNALCMSAPKRGSRVFKMIIVLLNEGLELPFAALTSLSLLLNLYNSNIVVDQNLVDPILDLIKQGNPLPQKSYLKSCLFFLLCQHVSPNDQSLYPAIRELIVKTENLDVCDESQKTPFDHFLENGGNLAQLFREIDLKILALRAIPYLDIEEEEYEPQAVSWPGNVTLALYDHTVRCAWLHTDDLSFLTKNILIAFAQFSDATLHNEDPIENSAKNEIYQNFLVKTLNKFNPIQKEEFIEALPERSKQTVKKIYCKNHGNFSDEKQWIKNHLSIFKEIKIQLTLNNKQVKVLDALAAFVAAPSSIIDAQDDKQASSSLTKQQLLLTLTEMAQKLAQMVVWVQDSRIEPSIKCIRQIIQEMISANKENEIRQFKECASSLGQGPLIKLKYKVTREALEKIIQDSENLDDVDWDEVVNKVFHKKDLNIPPCPGKQNDAYRPWKKEARQKLTNELGSCLKTAKISSINDVILWLQPTSQPMTIRGKQNEDDENYVEQPFSSPSKRRKIAAQADESRSPLKSIEWNLNS